jgi:hypothetical protein
MWLSALVVWDITLVWLLPIRNQGLLKWVLATNCEIFKLLWVPLSKGRAKTVPSAKVEAEGERKRDRVVFSRVRTLMCVMEGGLE